MHFFLNPFFAMNVLHVYTYSVIVQRQFFSCVALLNGVSGHTMNPYVVYKAKMFGKN